MSVVTGGALRGLDISVLKRLAMNTLLEGFGDIRVAVSASLCGVARVNGGFGVTSRKGSMGTMAIDAGGRLRISGLEFMKMNASEECRTGCESAVHGGVPQGGLAMTLQANADGNLARLSRIVSSRPFCSMGIMTS